MPFSEIGDAPHYLGVTFTTRVGLLEGIRDFLADAGGANWTITDDQITAFSFFKAKATYNGTDEAWVLFSIGAQVGITDGYKLIIQGDLDGSGATLSPDATVLNFIENAENAYWIVADAAWMNICIQSNTSEIKGICAGFLSNRVAANDVTAWVVGYLHNKLSEKYVAADWLNTDNWVELDSFWYYKDHFSNIHAPLQGICDRHTTAITSAPETGTSNRYPGHKFYNGQLNGVDGKPILSEYYHIEGDASNTSNYALVNGQYPAFLYCRGTWPEVYVGGGSLAGGAQFLAGTERYLVVGNEGWATIKIKFDT
jgi:hypothetical protein